jgi:uncharacterized protein (DUF1684 family)
VTDTLSAYQVATLLDWKRQVFALYERVRATTDSHQAWELWKQTRAQLFSTHVQSPLPRPNRGKHTPQYFDYDPGARVLADVHEAEPERYDIPTSANTTMGFIRFATARFELAGTDLSLELYWLEGYGGGLLVPFRDATSGRETYGGGRYLLDTVKGADLGASGERLVLDFNFAYNPSCAYDVRWLCPLAPPPNHLNVPIRAGERS